MKYGETTCFAKVSLDDPVLTGEESYRVIGPDISFVRNIRSQYSEIMRKMKGLNRHYSCLEKALVVKAHIPYGYLTIGSLMVWNHDRSGSYGHYYNPPLEFHAWVMVEQMDKILVVDFGLPGVIEKGLITADHIGPVLSDIEPVILCGRPFQWTDYTARSFLDEDECKRQAEIFSLDI